MKFLKVFFLLLLMIQSVSAEIGLRKIVDNLDSPLYMADPNDGSGRFFIVEKGGKIKILKSGNVLSTPFLDISSKVSNGGEQGLLGFAFDPLFKTNKRFFVNYTDTNGNTVVSSFIVSKNDQNVANSNSERKRLQIDQPFDNHNGGHLAFGPDKYLYIAVGDGGGGGDPQGNGQKLNTLLGKILRIDVSGSRGYKIPSSNPFYRKSGRKGEIYAYGLRNPWRFSFDKSDGRLFVADVGQGAVEEVSLVRKGDNLGWNRVEGDECYNSDNCSFSGLRAPIAVYRHDEGSSITGGYFFRGKNVPSFRNRYIFGDFISGSVFSIVKNKNNSWTRNVVLDSGMLISSFAEDRSGNLYLVDYNGSIYRFIE
jgi:glucose/arabinose dehydrogenase